ncbi:MAG TPA: hypothetical protein VF692_02440 [Pyrinomonadaceae bacterium]|jgi:hypothetical protein
MIDEKNKDTQNTAGTGNLGGTSATGGASASGGGASEKGNSGGESLSLDSAKETAKETARGLIDTAKSTAGQAYGVATEKATTVIDERKGDLASGLTTVADTIRQVGSTLRETDEQTGITDTAAQYGDSLAQQIEKISQYFERSDVRVMVRDVETFARRNPAVFVGGAFALGILAARFLKSSNPNAPRRLSGGKVPNDHLLKARNDSPVKDFRKPSGGTSDFGGGSASGQKSTENKPGNLSGTGGNTVTNPS